MCHFKHLYFESLTAVKCRSLLTERKMFAKLLTCQTCCCEPTKGICNCIFWNFYELNLSKALTNRYTTHKHLKQPEHSHMNLFGAFVKLPKTFKGLITVSISGAVHTDRCQTSKRKIANTKHYAHCEQPLLAIKFKLFYPISVATS